MIRTCVEDFQVEELPAYMPDGSGEHLYLWIEKRGLASGEMMTRVSRALQVRPGDIGIAGQKDRHAVTRQFISVPLKAEARLSRLDRTGIVVLSANAHRHKLRTGHLIGNRFTIKLRREAETGTGTGIAEWTASDISTARARLQELTVSGFPSYFGPQRFGRANSTLTDGLMLLQGQLSRKHWPFHQQRYMVRLVLSAVQSAIFNLVVADRIRTGTIEHPLAGDVVIRQNGTRPFLFTDYSSKSDDNQAAEEGMAPSSENSEAAAESGATYRLIPAGPMPGPKMLAAEGEVAEHERSVMAAMGLAGDEFSRFAKLCSGTRRAMLEFPFDVEADTASDEKSVENLLSSATDSPKTENAAVMQSAEAIQREILTLSFSLRSGAYATVMLREICENIRDAAGVADAADGLDDSDPQTEAG